MQDTSHIVVASQEPAVAPVIKADVKTEETTEATQTSAATDEAATKEASDTSEDTATDNDEETAEGSEELKASDDKPKQKSAVQKRIDKLRARQTQAEQRALQAEAKLQALLEERTSQAQDTTAKEAKIDDGKPNPDNFETNAEYIDALTDWKLEAKEKQKAQELEKQKVVQTYEELGKAYQESAAKLKAQATDFVEVMADIAHVKISAALENEFLNSELKAELVYEMAKDPDEFERIAGLPFTQAVKAIGVIEDRILRSKSEAKAKPETKKQTKAPAPLAPVGSNASVAKSLHELDPDAYIEARRAQMKRK